MPRLRPRTSFVAAFVVVAACGESTTIPDAGDPYDDCFDDPNGPYCNPPEPPDAGPPPPCDLDEDGECRECTASAGYEQYPSLCRSQVCARDERCCWEWGPRCVQIADTSCADLACYDAITIGGDANLTILRRTEAGFVSSVVPGSHTEPSSFAWSDDRLAYVTADGAAVARAVAGWDAPSLEVVIERAWPSACTTPAVGGPRIEWFRDVAYTRGDVRFTSACGTFEALDDVGGLASETTLDDGPGAALAGGLVVDPDGLRWWADGDDGPRGPGGTAMVLCDTDGDRALEAVIVGPDGLELVRPRVDFLKPNLSPWVAGSFRHVACADLDGNGDDEMIASSVDGPVVIADDYASIVWTSTEAFAGQGVGVGDLDGDDDVDLVVAEDGPDAPLHIYWNAGASPYAFTHEALPDPLPGHAMRQVTVHHLP